MVQESILENMTCVTPEVVDHVCRRIIQAIRPDKIIVFGSVARNEVNQSSDLDILVVVTGSSATDCRQIARKIDALLFGRRFGMDILVRTDQQINDCLQRGHSFYVEEVFRKGKILYDRVESGPKGREEIAASVRARGRAASVRERPEGPTGSRLLSHLRRSKEFSLNSRVHALTDVAIACRAFGAHCIPRMLCAGC
jgi:predicted nucleotidyltransferase